MTGIRKDIIQLVAIAVIFGGIYLSGLHTEVIGRLQQAIMWTGIYNAEKPENEVNVSVGYQFDLETLDGQILKGSELQNKVVFINFWATWCPPCIAEMPSINSLYKKMGKEVVFLVVSLDENKQKAKEFVLKKEFDFPVFFPASSLPGSLESNVIPASFVISKKGEIVYRREGIANYDNEEFEKFLREQL